MGRQSVSVLALLGVLTGLCACSPGISKREIQRLQHADRVTVTYHRLEGGDVTVTLSGEEKEKLLKVLANATKENPDEFPAATPQQRFEFFTGTNLLGRVSACADAALFFAEGGAYWDETGILEEFHKYSGRGELGQRLVFPPKKR